jgi:outer membrane protein
MNLNYIIFFIIICLFGYIIYLHVALNKVAVVDIFTLVNEFKMKKDLEDFESKKYVEINNKVDSLNSVIEKCKKDNNQLLLSKLSGTFYNLQMTAKQAYDQSTNEINQQIWKRLNPMVDQYGKENGFRIILGGNGMGSILYSAESVNITKELIIYINQKYEKGN